MVEDIQALIPHRPPFLYVDRIVEITQEHITTQIRIDPDEPFFRGHYPGNPVVPGVLVCEAIFQSGALLVANIIQNAPATGEATRGIPVLTRIREAKFKKMVLPGDLLEIEAKLIEKLGGAYFMRGVARIGGQVSVRVEFAATLADMVSPSDNGE
jgi:3-hydroxyacyl-[acyl-carrier-protein] dehydratase